MTRTKPPNDRQGETTKVVLWDEETKSDVDLYITVNRDEEGRVVELFSKATDGFTPHLEDICIPASLALQYGCPVEKMVEKLRYRNYPPHGNLGGPRSISDAVAVVLERTINEE